MADEERPGDASGGDSAAGPRSLIVGLRVFLLIVAASAVVLAITIATGGRGRGGDALIRYACPMHAEVRSAGPGECPICRMALEPIGFVPGAAGKPYQEAAGMVDLRAIDNVKKHNIIDFVRQRTLLPVQSELRGPAWFDERGTISAVFYNDQIEAMAPDEAGSFRLTSAPDTTFEARRTVDAPVAWDRSTSLIHFRPVAKVPARSPAGQAGWLEVAPRPRQVLTVAASALLQSPEGPYVLAWSGHGYSFVKRPIQIGETFLKEGLVVVLSGLEPHDRVIARATFFVDADRRMGTNPGEVALSALP
ncbi:MAG TPA: heavy metal-binding domain-containing protein [Polyangia bacterium]